jgi:hypothetical protein
METMNNITIVMTTFNNNDFTRSSIWATRKYYPKMRIILADGGSEQSNYQELINIHKNDKLIDVIQFYDGYSEDCRNIATRIVDTEFTLFMDNDAKMLGEEAINYMLDVMQDDEIAQTGAYAIIIADREKFRSYVGKEFDGSIDADGFSSYFSLHRTRCFNEVGGFPKEFIYDLPLNVITERKLTGFGGDFAISKYYQKKGFRVVTPKKALPVVHWGQAYLYSMENKPTDNWWHKNCNHIRCNPLNNWKELEKKYGKY